MAKSPDAFRTISEVSALLETPPHVLRFWEGKFQEIRPVKRAGGRRYYRPADIALLAGIKVLLHEQGLKIYGVQKLLREQGPRHVASLSPLPLDGPGPGDPEAGRAPGPAAGYGEPPPADGSDEDLLGNVAGGITEDVPGDVAGDATAAGLLARLAEADPERLRAQAGRLAPLVHRLVALRARAPAGTA